MKKDHGIIKVLLIIVIIIVGALFAAFTLAYEPNRAIDADITQDLNYQEMVQDLSDDLVVGKTTQVAVSEDVLNTIINNQLKEQDLSGENYEINYVYVDLGDNAFKVVVHFDADALGLEIPTKIAADFTTAYVGDQMIITLTDLQMGKLPVPQFMIDQLMASDQVVDLTSKYGNYVTYDSASRTLAIPVESILGQTSEMLKLIDVEDISVGNENINFTFTLSLSQLID